MNALYGARKAEICSIQIGEIFEVPSTCVEHYRCAAGKLGLKIRIVRHYRGRSMIQLTDRSNYGNLKAYASALQVGDTITCRAHQRTRWYSVAQRMGLAFRARKAGQGVLILTLCMPQPRPDIKGLLTSLRVGEALPPVPRKRAFSLCASAWNYRLRLSRAKISTGEYILTRAA